MSIRALFHAAVVDEAASPYNTLHLKVFYPAQMSAGQMSAGQMSAGQMSAGESEQNLGIVPADLQRSPFQVVILFGGINCGPELYQ